MRYYQAQRLGFGAAQLSDTQIAAQVANDISAQQVAPSNSLATFVDSHPALALGAGFMLMVLLLRGRRYR